MGQPPPGSTRVRGVAETTLRSYAYDLLHFLRWWVEVTHSTTVTDKAITEATLLDYIRFQKNQQPPPAAASINRRVGIAERALQLSFPLAQTPFVPGFSTAIGALCRSVSAARARH